ncbi:MAG: alpha/beta hydrolase, partial [Bacteroidetes bacterium]
MKYKFKDEIFIPVGNESISGELIIPENCSSLVIFSHGSGSSRFSPRNNFVARILNERNIGTFLLDLLTREEDEIYDNRFNIDLLTERLVIATKYLSSFKHSANLEFGYFGASTGAASALKAAAVLPKLIHAVVSRGGRPDLAMDVAAQVKAPTLLIVGELDYQVIQLNREAFKALKCEKKFEIIPGATHLFEEPGTLNEAALLAGNWFRKYLMNTTKKL